MKRTAAFFLCAVLLLSGCAAHERQGQQEGVPYSVYYLAEDLTSYAGGSALQTETVYLPEEASVEERAQMLIETMLQGPKEESLSSTLPANIGLESVSIHGGQAVVDFSSAYRVLSGIRLTLADYAVTLTLTQIPEILSVQITVQGQELIYRNRKNLSIRDIQLEPQGDVVGTVKAVLYFPSGSGGILTAESRILELYEGETQVMAVTRALEDGPENKLLTAVVPKGLRLKSVWVDERVCYANLSSELPEKSANETQVETAIRAIGMSLCSLEAVDEVWFLVDGAFAPNYSGVSIREPFKD